MKLIVDQSQWDYQLVLHLKFQNELFPFGYYVLFDNPRDLK